MGRKQTCLCLDIFDPPGMEATPGPLALPLAIGAVSVAAAAAVYFVSRAATPGLNPFENDSRVPQKPYEFNKAVRDTVIKNGYSSRKLDELGSINAIVIGSGEW